MCQYLSVPTAAGRKGIIKKFKYPSEGPMKSYVMAEQRILSSIVDGNSLNTSHEQGHIEEVLASFSLLEWPDTALSFKRPNPHQEKILINGVEISLKPSALISDASGKSGACKLFFNKAPSDDRPQLRPEVARMMAALLHYYGTEHLGDVTYKASLCQVVCVRDGDIYTSTGRYKKVLEDVADACEEIALRWPTL